MNSASAIIFDLDDTLIRSASIWREAEADLFRILGAEWDPNLAARYKGMSALDVAAAIHRIVKPDRPLVECQSILREQLIAGFNAIEAMPGAVELVRRVHGRQPLAVASGSPMPAIENALVRLGIREYFEHLLSSESVARGKPFPDIFLAASNALRVRCSRCLVFEDSLVGVRTARAAGMLCYYVPSVASQEIEALATRVFDSLEEVQDDALPDLFQPRRINCGNLR